MLRLGGEGHCCTLCLLQFVFMLVNALGLLLLRSRSNRSGLIFSIWFELRHITLSRLLLRSLNLYLVLIWNTNEVLFHFSFGLRGITLMSSWHWSYYFLLGRVELHRALSTVSVTINTLWVRLLFCRIH